jgi:hypothetical protein
MATIPKLFLDNRISVSDMTTSVVRISGQQINYFRITPDGTTFPSQIVFNNIITPSISNTLVGKNIRLRYQVSVTGAGTNDVALPKPAGAVDAAINGVLRAYPLQSIANSITLTINGSSSVVSQRQILSALQRCEKKSLREGTESEAPTQPDNLACLVPDGTGRLSQQVLSPYQNSDGSTRGSFTAYSYSGTNTNEYYFDVCESLLISPLTAEPNEVALPNINTLSLQINYSKLLDMLVFGSVAGAQAVYGVAGLTVNITNPVLELTYFSVANSLVHIPRMYETDYTNLVYFPKNQAAVATNALAEIPVNSDTLRFTSTPALIYIFLRPSMSIRDNATAGGACLADFFFPLGQQPPVAAGLTFPNFNITFGNRSGLLSSMSTQQAFKMSCRNGFQGGWREWLNAGCVLIINPALDLGLDLAQGDTIAGATGSVNFQYSATYNNANVLYANAIAGSNAATFNGAPLTTELIIIASYAGKSVITPDNCVFTTGFLSEAEVDGLLKSAPRDGTMVSDEVLKPTIQGAGLFSKAKSVLGHIARGVGAVAPHVETIAKLAQHPLVQSLSGGRMRMRGGVMSAA